MSKKRFIAPQASIENKELILNSSTSESKEDIETPEHKRALKRFDQRMEFTSIADKLAQDKMYIANYKYKEADEEFPDFLDREMRIVSKYYPYALYGELLVDEPRNDREKDLAYKKQKVLQKLGYRHVVIEPNASLVDCLIQLDPTQN